MKIKTIGEGGEKRTLLLYSMRYKMIKCIAIVELLTFRIMYCFLKYT